MRHRRPIARCRAPRRLAVALVCLSLGYAGGAQAKKGPSNAKELLGGLAGLPGLTADYKEEKFLTILVDPVISEGKVLFSPPEVLVRVTKAPMWSTLVVRKTSLTYTDSAGVQNIPVGKNHPARAFVQVFVDVVRGDLPAIEKSFKIGFTTDIKANTWEMTLNPHKGEFAGVRSVRMGGSGLVIAWMEVIDSAGDRTKTVFSAVKTTRRPSKADIATLLKKGR